MKRSITRTSPSCSWRMRGGGEQKREETVFSASAISRGGAGDILFVAWPVRDRWELGGRKIIGTFRGTLARPTFFEAINAEDRQTERARIDGKKKRGEGEKGRNPRRKNALAAERKYTRGRCVHPGRSKTRVRAHCCAASALSAAKRGQLKRDRNFGGRKLGKFFARVVEKKKENSSN